MKTVKDVLVKYIKEEYFKKPFDNWDDLTVKLETTGSKNEITIKNFRTGWLEPCYGNESLCPGISVKRFNLYIPDMLGLYIPHLEVPVENVISLSMSCKMDARLIVYIGKEV